MTDYFRLILALDDKQLERFVRDWIALKKDEYFEVRGFGGAGDLGRDVVGFVTDKRHEGPWHNYQCKQYVRRQVQYNEALIELAKTFYHADANGFTMPERYAFVAPHGLNRRLESLFDKPDEFRNTLLSTWDATCAKHIIDKKTVPLTAQLRAKIEGYNFGRVTRLDIGDIMAHPRVQLVLHRHFGADPGPAPRGSTPAAIDPAEIPYVSQLVDAYSERSGLALASPQDALDNPHHGPHLRKQRERFYDADFFMRYYRDNTAPDVLPTLENDIENGIFDIHHRLHNDTLDRIDAVMAQAATVDVSGPLRPHARVSVKQGVCHRFANDGRLRWKK